MSAFVEWNLQRKQKEFASDVWPGDALLLNAPSTSLNAQVVVRTVKLSYGSSYPDLVEIYDRIANDWADDLAIRRAQRFRKTPGCQCTVAPTVLANLSGLTVTP